MSKLVRVAGDTSPEAAVRKWHENHRAGMQAAAAKTEAHRLPGPVVAELKRRNRETHPCKVTGCKRTAYKGEICKAHWQTIPASEKVALTIAIFDAQLTTAARFHRRFLRQLNAKERAGASGGVTG